MGVVRSCMVCDWCLYRYLLSDGIGMWEGEGGAVEVLILQGAICKNFENFDFDSRSCMLEFQFGNDFIFNFSFFCWDFISFVKRRCSKSPSRSPRLQLLCDFNIRSLRNT